MHQLKTVGYQRNDDVSSELSIKRNGIRKRSYSMLSTSIAFIITSLIIIGPFTVIAQWSPNDPQFTNGNQWNIQGDLVRGGFDYAWDLTHISDMTNPGSNEIVVAVIDCGINTDHEDLQNILWTNRLDPAGDVDNDGDHDDDDNGFVDDIHGWNFYNGNANIDDTGYISGIRTVYHGTACAGIIAATINNNLGIAGGSEVSIMPLKAYGGNYHASGEQTIAGYFAQAVNYARNNGADIISISFTFDNDWDPLRTAIQNAYNDGCVIICSVENDDNSGVLFPGSYDEVLSVGGMRVEELGGNQFDYYRDHTDIHFGPQGGGIEFLDIGSATGDDLDLIGARAYDDGTDETFLTLPWGHNDGDRSDSYNVNGIVDGLWDPAQWNIRPQFYVPTCGNSFVAPQVSATAALMLSVRPSLTNTQIYSILRATANDIVRDETTQQNNLFGRDIFSGFGALDTHEAIRFANNWANRWGEDRKVSDLIQKATAVRASIDVDSMGYSHVVWIDNFRHEVCYRSLDPDGNVYRESIPLESHVNNPSWRSEEPRVRVDRENNIHIVWLRRPTPLINPEIRYTKISPSGTVLVAPKFIVHDGGQANKFDINLLTTDENPQNNNPTAIVIYTREVGPHFDIWMERVDTAGVSLAGFPMAITADNFDQIRVSASIFNLEQQQQRNEFIHLVFKDSNSALGNYDLQWMIIRTDGNVLLQERALVANGNSVNYPDVDCIYDGGNAAIVWTENGFVMYASVNPTGTHLTYHHGHNPVHVTDVGGYEGTRVAISQRDQDTTTCQVDVLYTKNWEIYLSELSLDGRVIQTDTIEAVTLAIAPEIVGIKDDSHISDFYDNTGNFFMVYPGDIALGVGANLYWRSTGFSSRTPHVLYYQDDHDVKDTYVTVDVYGGIHVAYSRTSYDSTEVFYQYFTDSSSLPDPDNFELCVSDQSSPGETDGADSFAPRIETICYYDEDEEEDMIDVYFFWLDEKDDVVEGGGVGNCNIYMRALSFGTDMLNENDLLNPDIQRCDFLSDDPSYSIQAFDTNLQINGIDASADEYNYQFYITWPSTLEIELAELDLENSDSQTITVSSGSQSPTEPSVVSDWFGVAYVVYNLQNQIRMTLVTHNGGSLLLDGTSDVTSVNDVCRNPTIAIDRNTNRIIKKSERYGALPNDYYSDRGKKFLHITFMMETATPNRYIPHYAKYDTDRNRLIAHSILPVASTFNFFGTDLSMFSWMDCDNRLVVGIQGNMDIGANPEWRDTSQFQGIHVMRLDSNGDIIVHESLLSHDGTVISYTSDVSHGNIAVDVHESDTTYCVWTSDKDGDESLYLTYSNNQ